LSAIAHGFLLAVTVISIPAFLNLIPLASLSSILLLVGYKLAKVDLFKQMYKLGWVQFTPFIITILAVLFTDLLKGILIGISIAILFILKRNYDNSFKRNHIREEEGKIEIEFPEQVTFINKGNIINMLNDLPDNSEVVLDGSRCEDMDYDVLEVIQEFKSFGSVSRNIRLEIKGINNLA
jgi:MFS superfamily sulfate permease-like transporter